MNYLEQVDLLGAARTGAKLGRGGREQIFMHVNKTRLQTKPTANPKGSCVLKLLLIIR